MPTSRASLPEKSYSCTHAVAKAAHRRVSAGVHSPNSSCALPSAARANLSSMFRS